MKFLPPVISVCRSFATYTIHLERRRARMILLFCALALAATAALAAASQAVSMRQLFLGSPASGGRASVAKAAVVDPLLTAVAPQSSATMNVARQGHAA